GGGVPLVAAVPWQRHRQPWCDAAGTQPVPTQACQPRSERTCGTAVPAVCHATAVGAYCIRPQSSGRLKRRSHRCRGQGSTDLTDDRAILLERVHHRILACRELDAPPAVRRRRAELRERMLVQLVGRQDTPVRGLQPPLHGIYHRADVSRSTSSSVPATVSDASASVAVRTWPRSTTSCCSRPGSIRRSGCCPGEGQ